VARARVSLLPDLPLGAAAIGAADGRSGADTGSGGGIR